MLRNVLALRIELDGGVRVDVRRVPDYYMHNRVFWGAISADLRRTQGAVAVEAKADSVLNHEKICGY
jgi:hypothetical protein